MKKILALVIAMALVMVGGVMGVDDTATADASVTVRTFVDITVTQCAGDSAGSISYGDQDPGAIDVQPVNCHNNTDGDLKVTVEETTNKAVTVEIKGTDYNGTMAETIPVGNTEYNDTASKSGASTLTTSYVTVWASMGGTSSGAESADLWFWLDIPDTFLTAGSYTSTYTLKASST